MTINAFSSIGVIGKTGRFYQCDHSEHVLTMATYNDWPYVQIHRNNVIVFDAFIASSKTKPTKAQFETLMDWCTFKQVLFEDVVTGYWAKPWSDWL